MSAFTNPVPATGKAPKSSGESGLPLTKLPLSAACRDQIERASGLTMQTVLQQSLCPRGLCYWNVDRLVRNFGGSMVIGWQHVWWPGRLAISMHHAIWRKPDGSLIDVTQKERSDCAEGTTFSADPSVNVDLSWPMFVPNVFLALSDHHLVGRAVIAFNEQIDAARQATDYVKARNGSFFPGRGLKLASGRMPKRISANIRRTNIRYQSVITQCGKLARPRPGDDFKPTGQTCLENLQKLRLVHG
jgi:hypothetical protein